MYDPDYDRDRYGRREPPRPHGGGDLFDVFFDLLGDLLGRLAAVVGRYAVELGLVAVPVGGAYALSLRIGRPLAAGAVGAVVAGVLAWGWSRRLLGRWLYGRRVRRHVGDSIRHIDAPAFRGRPPILARVRRVPSGDAIQVGLPKGPRMADLENMADALATALGVREVRVTPDRKRMNQATVTVVRRDPFDGPPLVWPHADATRLSVWEPVPVGVGDDGAVVTVALPERNVLLGGEPGAGKSAGLSLLVATAALDPDVRLWLLDGKMVELAAWEGCAERAAGPDIEDANALLRDLQTEMNARYAALRARGLRKVTRGDALPLHVVVCDELAFYLSALDRKARAEFADLMRDLVARGRAAGLIVLAATQKPSSDVIPTSLRDLFGFRWALRCSTPHASDTILGSGWAAQGYTASGIDPASRGVGWLLHEGGVPVLLRSFWLDDAACAHLAARAARLRAESGRGRDGL